MAVLTFTQDFSRGNDDRNQNIYETARITISLIVNNDDCSQDVRNCSGAVTARLRYEAVSTTNDPQFGQGGRTFGLVDLIPPAPGALPQAAAYARLQHQPANPPGVGGKLIAEIASRGTLPCVGGIYLGNALISDMPQDNQPPNLRAPRQGIVYCYATYPCGNVVGAILGAMEFPVPNSAPTPLLQLGNGQGPYPVYPGRPR